MRKPIRITTPYPTLDEVAKIYGITPKRQKELAEIMARIRAKQSRQRKTEKAERKGVSSKKAGRSRSSAS